MERYNVNSNSGKMIFDFWINDQNEVCRTETIETDNLLHGKNRKEAIAAIRCRWPSARITNLGKVEPF